MVHYWFWVWHFYMWRIIFFKCRLHISWLQECARLLHFTVLKEIRTRMAMLEVWKEHFVNILAIIFSKVQWYIYYILKSINPVFDWIITLSTNVVWFTGTDHFRPIQFNLTPSDDYAELLGRQSIGTVKLV